MRITGAGKGIAIATLGVACLLSARGASAAAIPSRTREAPPRRAVVDLGERTRRQVASVLRELGLEAAQVEERLSRLSAHDLEHLAAHPQQIRAGGGADPGPRGITAN